MNHEDNYWIRRLSSGGVSRRRFLGGAALLGVGAAALPLVGCGDDNSSKTPTGGSTTGLSGNTDLSPLKSMLKLPTDSKSLGTGLSLKAGSVLALSGSGSFYGGVMSKGINLATAQIKALGGPDISMTYKDHKSGDAQAGVNAARELGIANIPMCLSSYGADIGSMLPGIAQYKMLTLDGGGGASPAFQGKPYFYGTRAITPDDTFPGVYEYVSTKMPDVKSVQYIIWDLGAATLAPSEANLKKSLAKYNLNYLGMETAPIGTTDYSTLLARVKQKGADLLQLGIWGLDPGYFMKQFVTSGIKSKIMGSEFTPDAAKVAGSAYDEYTFCFDFFDANNPTNDWGKSFADAYKSANGAIPGFYEANYYEDTFALWELVRRVIAKGGNVKSGDDLNKALLDNPNFPSVYGGSGSTPGSTGIDPSTHTVKKRPMGIFTTKDQKTTMVASFDIGGADYKLV
jgi:branched-chain amino acid transport system substrate-binding protein